MWVCHLESAVFDDPNVVSCAGLAPVAALVEQCGLAGLVSEHLDAAGRGWAPTRT